VQGRENPSKVFESGPYVGKGNCLAPECPVGNVTWFEAAAFADLLSERSEPPLEPCYLLEGCSGELGKGSGIVDKPSPVNGFRLARTL